MRDLPSLVPGHIYMGTTVAGVVVRFGPTPEPERWQVGTSRPQATTEPVTVEEIPALQDSTFSEDPALDMYARRWAPVAGALPPGIR